MLPFGVGGSAGVSPGGRRRLAGRGRGPPGRSPGRQTKERARGQRPRVRSFRALCAQPPPPPERWDFPPPKRSIHHPFPPRLPTNQPGPPLPMRGGPAYSAGIPEKFSSRFSPAFFKSGPGVWGRSPQRAPGAEPLAGQRPARKLSNRRRARGRRGGRAGFQIGPDARYDAVRQRLLVGGVLQEGFVLGIG